MSETDEGGSCCCKSWSPFQRKLAYYVTFLIALILFIMGTLGLFSQILGEGSSPIYLVAGGVIIIINPLWIKSCGTIWEEMKQPIRWSSSLIFMISLAGLAVSHFIFKLELTTIIFSCLVILSGIWYFLSFFENGQKACVGCVKNCCCPDKEGGATS